MNYLQKLAGISAISQALIYISAFVYFGAFWSFPYDGSPLEKMTYLAENQLIFSLMCYLMYVVFGVFLAVLIIGLYEKLKHTNSPAISIGTLFGAIWVGLVIASGMISNIGLAHAIDMMATSTEKAFDVWTIVSLITESLGGGNELVGGLWVLLVSIAALRARIFPRLLNYLGLLVGVAGMATVYPPKFSPNCLVFPKSYGSFGWVSACYPQFILTSKLNSLRHSTTSSNDVSTIVYPDVIECLAKLTGVELRYGQYTA